MLILYHGSGSRSLEVLGAIDNTESNILITNIKRILSARGKLEASKFLDSAKFTVHEGTNDFSDEFKVLYALLPLSEYESIRAVAEEAEAQLAYQEIADVAGELGIYIRFIAIEYKLEDPEKYEFFICHASEDKQEVVEPLSNALLSKGAKVWVDHLVLTIGDSLSRTIDEGLLNSEYGIVIISPSFFRKEWPQRELAGLVQKEVNGKKVILPVWHNVARDMVVRHSPTLADKVAGNTSEGIDHLADKLMDAIGVRAQRPRAVVPPANKEKPAELRIGFKKRSIGYPEHHYALSATMTLNAIPDQGQLRLKIQWPKDISVAVGSSARELRELEINNISYREFIIDWGERVFPGETVDLLETNGIPTFIYVFDNRTWSWVERNSPELSYSLHFEDHLPIIGKISFKQLNVY